MREGTWCSEGGYLLVQRGRVPGTVREGTWYNEGGYLVQ